MTALRPRFDPAHRAEILAAIGPIIDAHHHYWDLEHNQYPWLQSHRVPTHFGNYDAICRTYLRDDFQAAWQGVNVVGSVHVEAHWRAGQDPAGETRWLASLGHPPSACVGHADVLAPDLAQVLAAHCAAGGCRGVRMMTRRAKTPSGVALLQDPRFLRGLETVAAQGLSFDLQATPDMMPAAAELARRVPQLTILLTHAGLPLDQSPAGLALWRAGLTALAQCPNVAVKLSGLAMADWQWTAQSMAERVTQVFDIFGQDRLCFGSNFPVDSLFSSYPDLVAGYAAPFCTQGSGPGSGLGADILRAIFHDTAQRLYRLEQNGVAQ